MAPHRIIAREQNTKYTRRTTLHVSSSNSTACFLPPFPYPHLFFALPSAFLKDGPSAGVMLAIAVRVLVRCKILLFSLFLPLGYSSFSLAVHDGCLCRLCCRSFPSLSRRLDRRCHPRPAHQRVSRSQSTLLLVSALLDCERCGEERLSVCDLS